MNTLYFFELLGTGFFAISGALLAVEKSKTDFFGVSFIGFITAIGGGSLRDVLLGSYPLVWIEDVYFVYVIIAGIIIARLFYRLLFELVRTFFLFDTFAISLFTVVGTSKALSLGVGGVNAAILGMFSAVMGGVMRDTLSNEIPIVFRKKIYATACFIGALVFLLLNKLNVNYTLNLIFSGSIIFIIRILAMKYNWNLPSFVPKEKDKNNNV